MAALGCRSYARLQSPSQPPCRDRGRDARRAGLVPARSPAPDVRDLQAAALRGQLERTEGGEALALDLTPWSWYAVWTHSHCEQAVHDQLVDRGFRTFLPIVNIWSRRNGTKRLIPAPMFPSYLFLRHQMDKGAYLDVTRIKGIVRVLGERWDRLSPIPDDEIEAIEKAASSQRRILPFPYVAQGQRARITAGPLTGVEGVLVESRTRQGLLVLSVKLLQRSVAVVVDGTEVTPV